MDTTTSRPLPTVAAHKRHQVAGSLREMVAGMRPGERLPSVTSLQKHFGVANSTIEAAVSSLQSEGLVARRQGSGTFVTRSEAEPAMPSVPAGSQPAARPLVGQTLITMSPQGMMPSLFSAMVSELEAVLRQAGYTSQVTFDPDAARRIAAVGQQWESGAIDGYVHIGSIPEGIVLPKAPGVVIGELPSADAAVHQVAVDNYDGGRRMAGYLWSLGHRRPAYVAMHDLQPAIPRYQGFFDTFHSHSLDRDDVPFVRVGWKGTAYPADVPEFNDALRALLDSAIPPTALFFGNDESALAGLVSLLSWGYRVPEDISVVSFDDMPGLANRIIPALTTIRMPITDLCSQAVTTLLQTIARKPIDWCRLRLPGELIVRESSGAAPIR